MFLELYTKWAWDRPDIDALVLDRPRHDGSPESLAREVYHRLVVRLLAIRVFRFQWIMLGVAYVAAVASAGAWLCVTRFWNAVMADVPPPDPMPCGLLIGVCAFFAMLVLPRFYIRAISIDGEQREAQGVVRRVFLRDIEEYAPADLCDTLRQGWLTSEGRPASLEISEADARSTEARGRALWWVVSAVAVAAGFGNVPGVGLGMLVGPLIFVKWMLDKNPAVMRAAELEAQRGVEGVAFVSAGGTPWAATSEVARKVQRYEAARDRSPIVHLGTTTGLLAARGDLHAPSAMLPFVLSLQDLQAHLLVLGGTGSGKTSGALRPIARHLGNVGGVGIVVLDGKGALPNELTDVPHMRVIDPAKQTQLSLVAGVEPVEIVSTIVDVLARDKGGSDRFWTDSAAALLRRCAVIARAAGGDSWTLAKIGQIAAQPSLFAEVVESIPDATIEADPMLKEAVEFFADEWSEMDERVRSNVIAVARSWMSTIMGHPHLLAWANTATDDPRTGIEAALYGGRVGLLLPAHRYGEAGAAVTALLKARLFAGLKRRAESGLGAGETPVLVVIDEAQEVATRDDATMLAIGRSLGLAVVAATQTVEGVTEKLGDAVSKKWLGIFGSVLAFPGRSPATDEFVAARAGQSWQPAVEAVEGVLVRSAVQMHAVTGAAVAGLGQRSLLEGVDPEGPVLDGLLQRLSRLFRRRGAVGEHHAPMSKIGPRSLVQAGEVPTLLAEPNTALALVTRARVLWRDVIRVTPMYR